MADKEQQNPWPKRLGAWKKFSEKFHERGRAIEQRYEDERDAEMAGMPGGIGTTGLKKVNMFYSNTTVIKESLYNSLPKPEVTRLHKGDYDNEPARVAAQIMQRGLHYEIHCAPSFDTAIKSSILDRLVPGLGVVWCEFQPPVQPKGDKPGKPEFIKVEIIYWKDFIYEPRRAWEQVTWAGRVLHMSREDAVAKWGDKFNAQVAPKNTGTSLAADTVNEGKVCVIQMWDKKAKEVLHMTMDGKILDRNPDPYDLKDFFPCPKPLIASPPTSKFLPIPDYYIAQDQYMELDILYARINLIIEAVRVSGCYDAATPAISRMLDGAENKLIPVDNWALFAEKGGIQGAISWYPVETVTQVLSHLTGTYDFIKNQLFEVTGMADIVRGSTNEYETAAAQQIKAKFASVRMNGFQRDVGFFVRDTVRIIGELMCQMYSDEKLSQVCGQLPQDDQQFVPMALQILHNDFVSSYNIDIETDSLTQADWGLEQAERMEYVSTVSQLLQAAIPSVEANPALGPLVATMLKFAAVGFKGATELEGALDSAITALAQAQQQAQANPKPDPKQQEMQMKQQESQQRMQEKQQDSQLKREMQQAELAFMERKFTMEMEFNAQKNAAEISHKQEMARLEAGIKAQHAAVEEQQNQTRFVQERVQDAEAHDQNMRQDQAETAAKVAAKPKPQPGGKL